MTMSFGLHDLTDGIDPEYRIETGRDNWHIDSTACPSFVKSAVKDTSASSLLSTRLYVVWSCTTDSLVSGWPKKEGIPCRKRFRGGSKGSSGATGRYATPESIFHVHRCHNDLGMLPPRCIDVSPRFLRGTRRPDNSSARFSRKVPSGSH